MRGYPYEILNVACEEPIFLKGVCSSTAKITCPLTTQVLRQKKKKNGWKTLPHPVWITISAEMLHVSPPITGTSFWSISATRLSISEKHYQTRGDLSLWTVYLWQLPRDILTFNTVQSILQNAPDACRKASRWNNGKNRLHTKEEELNWTDFHP